MSRRAGWLLALLSTAFIVAVLTRADRYADGDMGHLVAVEVRIAQMLRSGDLVAAARFWWALIAPQPPIGYLPGIAAFTVFGARAFVAPLTMGISLLLCWDALTRLWGERAWLAWVPLIASPFVWLGMEQHSRDLVCGAALLQAVSWLVTGRGFADRRASVAFGVWLGVGFMTKYTFPIFAVFACLWGGGVLLLHTVREPEGRADRWRNFGLAVAGFLVPAGAWYAFRGMAVLQYAGFSVGDGTGVNAAFRDPYALANLVYYPLALRDALSLPGVVLVGLAGLVGLVRRADRAPVLATLAAALGGLGVLSLLPQAVDRYALPAFLALAAVLPALGFRRWGPLPILVIFLAQGWATVTRFAPGAPTALATYDHPLSAAGELAWPAPSSYTPSDLRPSDWHLDDAAAAIRGTHGRDDGTIGVLSGSGPNSGPSFATVLLATSRKGYHYDFATISTSPPPGGPDVFVGPLFDGTSPSPLFSTLYVVRTRNADGAIDRWLGAHSVQETARFPGPDGGESVVYKVVGASSRSAPPPGPAGPPSPGPAGPPGPPSPGPAGPP